MKQTPNSAGERHQKHGKAFDRAGIVAATPMRTQMMT